MKRVSRFPFPFLSIMGNQATFSLAILFSGPRVVGYTVTVVGYCHHHGALQRMPRSSIHPSTHLHPVAWRGKARFGRARGCMFKGVSTLNLLNTMDIHVHKPLARVQHVPTGSTPHVLHVPRPNPACTAHHRCYAHNTWLCHTWRWAACNCKGKPVWTMCVLASDPSLPNGRPKRCPPKKGKIKKKKKKTQSRFRMGSSPIQSNPRLCVRAAVTPKRARGVGICVTLRVCTKPAGYHKRGLLLASHATRFSLPPTPSSAI